MNKKLKEEINEQYNLAIWFGVKDPDDLKKIEMAKTYEEAERAKRSAILRADLSMY